MRFALPFFLAASIGCAGTEHVASHVHVDEPGLVSLATEAGRTLLAQNLDDADAIPLLSHFESQRYGSYCGIASSVIVMNALGREAPPNPALGTFRYNTQESVVGDAETASVAPAERINTQGMTLDELGGILRAHSLDVTVVHGADIELDSFRTQIREGVAREGDFLLVNYFRPGVGQQGGGHISPIAAYDEETDRALILDVAQYRYPPAWVEIETLWSAIRTTDDSSGLTRGFVVASAR